MILINHGDLRIQGSSDQIGAEVTELIVSLKEQLPEVLEAAMLTADDLIASGKKLTIFEHLRRVERKRD